MDVKKHHKNMDTSWIKSALCYHGKPMKKTWEDEYGNDEVQKMGITEDENYSIYTERQKYFIFQDRAKRLKIHQFLAHKSVDLYDSKFLKSDCKPTTLNSDFNNNKYLNVCAQIPPYEMIIDRQRVPDKSKILRHLLKFLQPGNIIYGTVIRGKSSINSTAPVLVKALCTGEPTVRLLADTNLKAFIPSQLCGSSPLDKHGKARLISTNDYVCCAIHELSVDTDRMTLSLENNNPRYKNYKIGVINADELPILYRKSLDSPCFNYENYLRCSRKFENPNYDILYTINDLNVHDNFTMMSALKYEFPQKDYAKELRQVQASRWAFRSVADGIEYFKIGKDVEAFQCLNKALTIDPRNVEGLVARGALYANKGSFLKAVDDFEKALKLNSYHVNARKYMGETLVALGRNYESNNKLKDAVKAYQNCLNIIPKHVQAKVLLLSLVQRTGFVIDGSSLPSQQFAEHQAIGSSSTEYSNSCSSRHSHDSYDGTRSHHSNFQRNNNSSSSTVRSTDSSYSNNLTSIRSNRSIEDYHQSHCQRRRRRRRRRRAYESNRRRQGNRDRSINSSSTTSNESNRYSSDQKDESQLSSINVSENFVKNSQHDNERKSYINRKFRNSMIRHSSESIEQKSDNFDFVPGGKSESNQHEREQCASLYEIGANELKLDENDKETFMHKVQHDVFHQNTKKSVTDEKEILASNASLILQDKTSAHDSAILQTVTNTSSFSAIDYISDKVTHANKSNVMQELEDTNNASLAQNVHIVKNQLNENLKLYEKSIEEIKKRHDHFKLATGGCNIKDDKVNTSPSFKLGVYKTDATPYAMMNSEFKGGTSSLFGADGILTHAMIPKMTLGAAIIMPPNDNSKLSFQIRKPVKMDKFGLVRLVTPEIAKSASSSPGRYTGSGSRSRSRSRSRFRSHSRSRSHSRTRSRTRSRSPSRLRRDRRRSHSLHSRSRSRSRDRRNYFNKYANRSIRSPPRNYMMRRDSFSMRSLTRSPSQTRSRMSLLSPSGGGRGRGGFRRRRGDGSYQRSSPSLFSSRRYMPGNIQQHQQHHHKRNRFSRSPHHYRSMIRRRSRDCLSRSSTSTSSHQNSFARDSDYKSFSNRTWHRSPLSPLTTTMDKTNVTSVVSSIPTFQIEKKITRWDPQKTKIEENKIAEDPSIEEIDDIIDKAQKERKQEIIKRNKEIVKKTAEGNF